MSRASASLAVLAFLLVLPAAAGATPIGVTSTADNKTDDQLCTLREAVDAANTNAVVNPIGGNDCPAGQDGAVDTITLPPGTYQLTLGTSGDDQNLGGDLDFRGAGAGNGGPAIIDGAPIGGDDRPLAIIDGGDNDRLIDLIGTGDEALNVQVQSTSLRNGDAGSGDGGAVLVGDPDADFGLDTSVVTDNDAGDNGGAISFPSGVTGSSFSVEQAEFSGNTAGDEGGALWLDMPDTSPINIKNSALISNSAATMGGGVYIENRAMNGPLVFFTNSTLSGNSATTAGGAVAFDAAEAANVYFAFSTIANNSTATGGAGGAVYSTMGGVNGQFIYFSGGSIVAGNTAAGAASNCVGPGDFQSGGYNIDSTNSCFGTPAGTDLVNTDPLLAPLALNGGGELTTRTLGLYDSSPAVNRIPPGSCGGAGGIDQRYVVRPVGGNCDVGAFEGSVGPAPGAVHALPATPSAAATKCKKKKKKPRSVLAAKKKKCKKKKKKR